MGVGLQGVVEKAWITSGMKAAQSPQATMPGQVVWSGGANNLLPQLRDHAHCSCTVNDIRPTFKSER